MLPSCSSSCFWSSSRSRSRKSSVLIRSCFHAWCPQILIEAKMPGRSTRPGGASSWQDVPTSHQRRQPLKMRRPQAISWDPWPLGFFPVAAGVGVMKRIKVNETITNTLTITIALLQVFLLFLEFGQVDGAIQSPTACVPYGNRFMPWPSPMVWKWRTRQSSGAMLRPTCSASTK